MRAGLAVNVMSGVRLSRAYLPDLIHRGWGRVIFISSGSAKCPLNVLDSCVGFAALDTFYAMRRVSLETFAAGARHEPHRNRVEIVPDASPGA